MKTAAAPRPLLFPTGPVPWLKPAVFAGALIPVGGLALRAYAGTLGANPIAEGLNQLGLLALIFLIASLTCTPLKTLTGWSWPIRIRKMLGLFGFFYASMHLLTYAGLDQTLDFKAILKDIAERKFILVGFLAYVAATLGVLHFVLRVKKDLTEPLIYGGILALLFAVRIASFLKERRTGR